ncbi:MAG: hypothetical protein H7343_12250 [Undibacterium sp.]|nr:hypothetical protein [Opitutaceae bacterium]
MPLETTLPLPFAPYLVAGIGTVEGYDGPTYLVRVPSGAVHGVTSPSGTPSAELAAAEIAYALAHPPVFVVPVPAAVTRRQLLQWLNAAPRGITRAALSAALAGNEVALIDLQEAAEFQRTHPLVATLAAQLGIDADTAFREAALL